MKFGKVVAAAAAAAALCLVMVACGDSSNPVSPRSVTAGAANIDPEPTPTPTPTPPGPGCSPGYWKNHESHFTSVCAAAAALPGDVFTSCGQLLTAITCTGNQPGCTGERRQAAAAALNTVSGCTETD